MEPGAPHIGVVARALKGCDVEGFLEVFRRKWAKRAKQQDPKLEGTHFYEQIATFGNLMLVPVLSLRHCLVVLPRRQALQALCWVSDMG